MMIRKSTLTVIAVGLATLLIVIVAIEQVAPTTAVRPPTERSDKYTVIWDVYKGSDQHEYLRFAVEFGYGGGCSVVHAEGCSHPDCVARRIAAGRVDPK